MKFTKLELEIINHRLEVPDAITDNLHDEHGDGTNWDLALDVVNRAVDRFNADGWDNLSEDFTYVLRNAIEGSTFFAGMDDAVASGEMSKGKALAYYKAAKSIERKTKWSVNLT